MAHAPKASVISSAVPGAPKTRDETRQMLSAADVAMMARAGLRLSADVVRDLDRLHRQLIELER